MANCRAILFDLDGTLVDTIPDIAHAVNMALGELGVPGHSVEACRTMVGWGVHELARRALLAASSTSSSSSSSSSSCSCSSSSSSSSSAAAASSGKHTPHRTDGVLRGGASSSVLFSGPEPSEAAVEDLAQRIARWFRARPYQYSRPYDGMAHVLETFQERGVGLGVVTNKPHEIAEPVCHAAFPSVRFASIQGAGHGFPPKPDPGVVYHSCHRLGVKPDEVVLVGDSVVDIETARNSGCTPVAVRWGYGDPRGLEEEGPKWLLNRPEELLEMEVRV